MKYFLIFFIFLLAASAAGDICVDRTAPGAPGSLAIADSPYDADGIVTLSWDKAVDYPTCSGVSHYNIYRSFYIDRQFVKIAQTESTSYEDSGLELGRTYYYQVSAVDVVQIAPHEGPYSSTVWTTIGTAPKKSSSGGGGRGGGGGSYVTTATEPAEEVVELIEEPVETECQPDWVCEAWSNCVDGMMDRVCTDSNDCGKEPPLTAQECTTDESGEGAGNNGLASESDAKLAGLEGSSSGDSSTGDPITGAVTGGGTATWVTIALGALVVIGIAAMLYFNKK